MPIPPSNPPAGEPVFSILNATKARLHERMSTLIAVSGTILKETEPTTQQAFNSAYRKLQSVMAKAGSATFEQNIVIYAIPPVSQDALDPATECWISTQGCSDGTDEFSTPTLPSDLMTPLWMSERWNGSMQPLPGARVPNMRCMVDGLDNVQKTNYNGQWQWRGEVIYYPGSLQTMDFRIYYQKYLPDMVDVGQAPWFEQNVPITRCQDALSQWLCREFAMMQAANPELDADVRGQWSLAMTTFEAEAMDTTAGLVSPDKKRKQRTNYSRLPFAGGGRGGGFGGIGSGGIPAFTGS